MAPTQLRERVLRLIDRERQRAENAARGHINISGRPLMFVEPEGEHAAAAVTASVASWIARELMLPPRAASASTSNAAK